MKAKRKLNRRSFLGAVAGGASLGGGALIVLAARAAAQNGAAASGPGRSAPRGRSAINDGDKNPTDAAGRPGCTDRDSGPRADPPAGGRGSGVNDNDRGTGRSRARPLGDRANCGRRARQR